jgi:hypothetical protein
VLSLGGRTLVLNPYRSPDEKVRYKETGRRSKIDLGRRTSLGFL